MTEPIKLGLFDPDADYDVSHRHLPHWFQLGVLVFLTFRTADSMPRRVVHHWHAELREWLRARGMQIANDNPLPEIDQIPRPLQRDFRRMRDRLFHCHLDQCHGKCVLRRRDLAEIVMNSLRHFDGQCYDLDSAIVMPNHVHVLVQFRPPTTCRLQCESWLHFTATQINRKLGLKGAFWQSEPFDHLVRSVEQFLWLRRYLAENGIRANLPETDWLYWAAETRRGASCHTISANVTYRSAVKGALADNHNASKQGDQEGW